MAKKNNVVRSDGRIAVQVYIGRVDGKRKYKTLYGYTQKEADEKARQLKLSMRKGLDVTAENDTFEDWAEYWINIKSGEVSNSQAVVYGCAIKHLNSYIKDIPITKIRTADLQLIITNLSKKNPNTKKPASKKTLKSIKSTAAQIFRLAIENRVMDYNPADAIKIPNTTKPQYRRALTEEEQKWIVDTDHRARRAAMIMMYAGLRRGELIALTWNDIDLENRTITVNKSVEMVGGKSILKNSTKTKNSNRTIDIPQRLVSFLQGEKKEGICACVTTQNKMHTASSWKRMWNDYLNTLNLKYGEFETFDANIKSKFDKDKKELPFVIPKITAHWLRHTFATMLYFAGVDVLTAKDQLGHSDIKTALDIYTHLDAKYKRKSMNKLDEYLESASQKYVIKLNVKAKTA